MIIELGNDIEKLIPVINKITKNLSCPVRKDNLNLIYYAFATVGHMQEKALWVFEVTDMMYTYIILRANALHYSSEEIYDERMNIKQYREEL